MNEEREVFERFSKDESTFVNTKSEYLFFEGIGEVLITRENGVIVFQTDFDPDGRIRFVRRG